MEVAQEAQKHLLAKLENLVVVVLSPLLDQEEELVGPAVVTRLVAVPYFHFQHDHFHFLNLKSYPLKPYYLVL